jgi:hypothetical protein
MNRGALLAKEKLQERGQKAKLSRELEVGMDVVSHWLSGDRKPSTVQRAYLEDQYGIGWRLWDEDTDPESEPAHTGTDGRGGGE